MSNKQSPNDADQARNHFECPYARMKRLRESAGNNQNDRVEPLEQRLFLSVNQAADTLIDETGGNIDTANPNNTLGIDVGLPNTVTVEQAVMAGPANPASEEQANTPIGEAQGINPGRVAMVRDTNATDWDGTTGYYWEDSHTNQPVVQAMMGQVLRWLTGESTDVAAWDSLFNYFNSKRGLGETGYVAGEGVVIKCNLNESTSHNDVDNYSDLTPATLYALVDQLVNVAGVPQNDIYLYDAIKTWSDKLFYKIHDAFPGVHMVDRNGGAGRDQVRASDRDMMYWSDGGTPDKLPTVVVDSKYMINLAILKKHEMGGVTLAGKNHYGTFVRTPTTSGYYNLHNSLPIESPGMGQYRALTDITLHQHLGGKTMLYLLDGIWGGWASCMAGSNPTKWLTTGNDWVSSLFASQDPVAIDSVGYDFLQAEEDAVVAAGTRPLGWTGNGPIRPEADDYMHEAALAGSDGARVYTPNGDGVPAQSAGVHEHWNNDTDRQYTRNLGTGYGIELVRLASEAYINPTVQISSPAANTNFTAGSNITITAQAQDADGSISKVEFYSNGSKIGEDANPDGGWSFTYNSVPQGAYRFTAKAVDDDGAHAFSDPVDVSVGTVVTLQAIDPDVIENSDSGEFRVYRTGSTSGALTVNVSMSGTATNGTDYNTIAGTVVIPIGQSWVPVTLSPKQDSAGEGNETAILTITSGAGYVVGLDSSATATIVDNDAPTNLIAWWKMEESSGDVTDSSGNDHTLTNTATTSSAGILDNARTFNGSANLTDSNGETYINGLSAFTVAAWLNPSAPINEHGWFITDTPAVGDSNVGISIRFRTADDISKMANSVIRVAISTTAGETFVETNSRFPTTKVWVHVAVVWSSGNAIKVFVNGDEAGVYNNGNVGGTITGATQLMLGNGPVSGSAYKGALDDVRIYGAALTATQIAQIYNRPPHNIAVERLTPTTAKISWNNVPTSELGYRIERSSDGVSFGEIDTVDANVTTYNDSGLTADNTYYHRIRAFNASGSSASPNHNSAYTKVAQTTGAWITGQAFRDVDQDGVRDVGEAALFGELVYIDANNNGAFDTKTYTQLSSSTNLNTAIPDKTRLGVNNTITVNGISGPIVDVSVIVNITHPEPHDLQIFLTGPGGAEIKLMANPADGTVVNLPDTAFDDHAYLGNVSTQWGSPSSTFSDRFKPLTKLSAFNNYEADGSTWTLRVADWGSGNSSSAGVFNYWMLIIGVADAQENFALVNADGGFQIKNLNAGLYNIRSTKPDGSTFTTPDSYLASIATNGRADNINFGVYDSGWSPANGGGDSAPLTPLAPIILEGSSSSSMAGDNGSIAATGPVTPATDVSPTASLLPSQSVLPDLTPLAPSILTATLSNAATNGDSSVLASGGVFTSLPVFASQRLLLNVDADAILLQSIYSNANVDSPLSTDLNERGVYDPFAKLRRKKFQ